MGRDRPRHALYDASPRVSIHAPAWGATDHAMLFTMLPHVFQSTRPHGARHADCLQRGLHHNVSIHAPAWGATLPRGLPWGLRRVSIHAPAWGATADHLVRALEIVFVSIHAPAWGATSESKGYLIQFSVSIHAPAWGATPVLIPVSPGQRVSIHAPAWGATSSGVPSPEPCACFNPRARMGRDLMACVCSGIGFLFQSTRPHGARQNHETRISTIEGFNPRARMGRDIFP